MAENYTDKKRSATADKMHVLQVHYKNFGSHTAIRCGYLSGKYNCPPHIHQFAEIVVVTEGELFVTVDSVTERLTAGDIAIIPPLRIHSFSTPQYTRRWLCVFSDDFIKHLVSDDELYGMGSSFSFRASDELITYIMPMMIEGHEKFLNLEQKDIRSFKTLITVIYEAYLRDVGELVTQKKRNALSSILTYIALHCREKLSLHSIGAALGYSPKYVSACLSQIEEMSLFKLINSFRANYAKELLKTTDFKVIDIAFQCGYLNEKSFHRAFRQVTGVTPGQYRKNRQTTQISNGKSCSGTLKKRRNIQSV